jgi:heme exporter protein A
LLEVQGLTCFRQNRCLFADLNFVLSEGQICQIEGVNGAGKSTLLRAILGLFRPDEGRIIWDGRSTTKQAELFLQHLFFLGHKFAINSDLTPWQNLEFWAALNPTNNTDFTAALSKVGLTGLEHIPCHSLSAGQHRRVALARLWLTNTKLWILDEPFTAIDKSGVQLLQQRFNTHLQSGGMILITSHQDLSKEFNQLIKIKLNNNIGQI